MNCLNISRRSISCVTRLRRDRGLRIFLVEKIISSYSNKTLIWKKNVHRRESATLVRNWTYEYKMSIVLVHGEFVSCTRMNKKLCCINIYFQGFYLPHLVHLSKAHHSRQQFTERKMYSTWTHWNNWIYFSKYIREEQGKVNVDYEE